MRDIAAYLICLNVFTPLTEPDQLTQKKLTFDNPATNLDASPFFFNPSVTCSDVRVSAKVRKGTRTYIDIDNILDELPPFGSLGTGSGDAIYTNTNRFLYAGIGFKF